MGESWWRLVEEGAAHRVFFAVPILLATVMVMYELKVPRRV
jgi:hypothetical protein